MRRTAVINQIRGLLLERGITVRQGRGHIDAALPGILSDRAGMMVSPTALKASEAGNVARKPVTVGHEDMQSSIVTEGLQPNETLVVDGASRLQAMVRIVIPL